jgi:cytochrome oxidase assembly protein ShyY1
MPKAFRLRLIPLISTLVLCILGVSLGQWQTRRALEKEDAAKALVQRAQQPPITAADLNDTVENIAFRRLSLRGEFVQEWPLYLDNRSLHGLAGFYVLMPFKIQGSDQHVLVVRGWQPRNSVSRTQMPLLKTPGAIIQLEGVIRPGMEKAMQLGANEAYKPGAILQNLNIPDGSRQMGMKIFDFVVDQTNDTADGLLRDWTLPSVGSEKNRAYAFQWYALSLMAVIFFVVTGFRRGKSQ